MPTATQESSTDGVRSILETSQSMAFHLWLLISASAIIIMAQDTWLGSQQPRMGTIDATAEFTKVLAIHAIWLLVSLAFLVFTWIIRPTRIWMLHIAISIVAIAWTVGVMTWAFADVERLEVTALRCEAMPDANEATAQFLASCQPAEIDDSVRIGNDIYLWSMDDEHFWRWIVPRQGLVTMHIHWPRSVEAIYLMSGEGSTLHTGTEDSSPGGLWNTTFDPVGSQTYQILFIEQPTDDIETTPTPES